MRAFGRDVASTLIFLLVGGCFVAGEDPEPRNNDGEVCAEDADCSSGICASYRLCAHTRCNCSGSTCSEGGEVVEVCKEGWLCSDADSIFDGVEEFFGGTPAMDQGYCHLPCDMTCPEHYYCNGTSCVPNRDWVDPVVTVSWSGAIVGSATHDQTVQLEAGKSMSVTASATSPLEIPLEPFAWTVVRSSGERAESVGDAVEFTLLDEAYVRVELIVRDTEFNSVSVHVAFESCLGAGTQCGYQGSGCCKECDRDANVCL
jgi:hypothetical protein